MISCHSESSLLATYYRIIFSRSIHRCRLLLRNLFGVQIALSPALMSRKLFRDSVVRALGFVWGEFEAYLRWKLPTFQALNSALVGGSGTHQGFALNLLHQFIQSALRMYCLVHFFLFRKGYEGVHFEVLFLLRVHHGFETCLTWETSRYLSRGRILSYMSQDMGSPTSMGNLQLFMVLGGGLSEVFLLLVTWWKSNRPIFLGACCILEQEFFFSATRLQSWA